MKKYLARPYQIGRVKYSIDFYDGIKKHKDGSEFWDIALFTNLKDYNQKIFELEKNGYRKLWMS
jgi:hypothetical protein